MVRVAVLSLVTIALVVCLAVCGKSSGNREKTAAPEPAPGTANVPAPTPPSGDPCANDDPRFHVKPEEATLTVGSAEGAAGSEATAAIKVVPAAGYHVSTDFPMKLTLQPPAGVTLAKSVLAKADADQLTEQGLALSVKATAAQPGTYEIKGCFMVGVCDKDSCHPKKQPITITALAK
jgi:hypothetical protein